MSWRLGFAENNAAMPARDFMEMAARLRKMQRTLKDRSMRVFLDTEFTDFSNPRLISAGLVAEDGREFYCELDDDWTADHCTDFVLDTVLPLLGGVGTMTRDEAGARLVEWLTSLGSNIAVISDTETDWQLLMSLIKPYASSEVKISGELLCWPGHAMARRHEDLLEELLENAPARHHALVDARALRRAVLQTEAEFRAR
jgi:hypothetical protein